MSEETVGISIEIMDKIYQIKCPEAEINSLQRAARYLEEKMCVMRQAGTLSVERIAIITALNIVHQLLMTEQQTNHHFQFINQRLQDLHLKIDQSITENAQMELETANAD